MRSRALLSATAMVSTVMVTGSIAHTASASASAPSCGPSWSIAQSSSSGNHFTGISAVATNNVWAVGFTDSAKINPIAWRWNGSTWGSSNLPKVAGVGAEFDAVSMDSAGQGWAVGYAQTSGQPNNVGNYATLIEGWNGTKWSVAKSTDLGPGTNLLAGVANLSATDAWAVGYGTTTGFSARQTLAEHWNGTSWSTVPSVNVSATNEALLSVSAVPDAPGQPSSDVWAVGYSTNAASQDQALIEQWNGTSWAVVASDPSTPNGVLTSVSVDNPSDAWAVGYTDSFQPLLEHWDGSAWTLASPPASADPAILVRSVVATSPTDAWAVGTAYDPTAGSGADANAGAYVGVAMYWNGSDWSYTSMASPPQPLVDEDAFQLRSVTSLASTDTVWAAGGIPGSLVEQICSYYGTTTVPGDGQPPGARGTSHPTRSTRAVRSPALEASAQPTTAAPSSEFAVDEAASSGIGQATIDPAAVVSDFDHNGRPDIFLDRTGQLFLNQGNGSFESVDQNEFPANDRFDCTTADVAGNGGQDIFCVGGAHHGNALKANELYMEGAGTNFTNQSAQYGLLDPSGRGRFTTFLNATGGTHPDLFVANDPFRADGLPDPNRLYVDTGSGYQDAPQLGLDLPIGSACASTADYLHKGFDDLLLCPVSGPVRLFQDQGGKGFVDATKQAGLPSFVASDALFVDLNGDGWPDIVLIGNSKLAVYLQNPTTHKFALSYSLSLSAGAAVAAGDANGDGHRDLFVAQGSAKGAHAPDLLLLNDGTGKSFTSMAIPQASSGGGVAAYPIDFEGNGLTDFLVLNGPNFTTPGPVQLLSFFPGPVSISAISGTPASAPVGQALPSPLVAHVSDASGAPVPGVTVIFTAPIGGPSATLDSGTNTEQVTTDLEGDASVAATANDNGGTYQISASISGAAPTEFNITNTTAPGAPVMGSATAGPGDAQATITFSPPASDGGAPIEYYTVTATDNTNPANGNQTTTGTTSPITISGLTDGDDYTFTVTATNTVGTSPPSDPSNDVYPQPPPTGMRIRTESSL